MRGSAMFEKNPDELIYAVLRGESTLWPEKADLKFQRDFFHALAYHGVDALVYVRLNGKPAWELWPADVREAIRAGVRARAAQELARQREIISVLGALAQAGVQSLLMKGTPLAHTLYASPVLRCRGDTDLLIQKKDLVIACSVLADLGYQRGNGVSGKLISSEFCYARRDSYGVTHELDLHWRISSLQLFANILTYEETEPHSVSVPALGPYARALGDVHALLLACVHRLSHARSPYYINHGPHYGANRLIWLYDIYLLGKKMTPGEWDLFAQAAQEKGLRNLCLDGVKTSSEIFGNCVPPAVVRSLSAGEGAEDIPISRLARSHLRWLLSEFRALPDWRQRVTLAKENLFPPASYMLSKYRSDHRMLLPLLYVHRAIKGVWRYGK